MAIGPGKYDELCTYVRTNAKAAGAIVLVLNGRHGDGFSAQAAPEVLALLPVVLRNLADDIEANNAHA